MKKLSLLVLFFVVFGISNVSQAQQFFPRFGVKGGMSNSTQNVDLVDENFELEYEQLFKYRAGYTFGVFADILWYKYVTFGTGLDFFQKGYQFELPETNIFGEELGIAKVVANQNYLIWNVYAKISPPGLEKVHPYVIIAPRLDFFLGYTQYLSNSQVSNKKIEGQDPILEKYKKVSPSVSFGAGVEINKIIPYSILVEFMYVPDLFSQFGENENKFWNTSYSISAGLKF